MPDLGVGAEMNLLDGAGHVGGNKYLADGFAGTQGLDAFARGQKPDRCGPHHDRAIETAATRRLGAALGGVGL